jgi:hypothetical protein
MKGGTMFLKRKLTQRKCGFKNIVPTAQFQDLGELDPVDIHFYFHFSTNFCSFLRKIFRNIPDIPKNFTQKSLKISEKLKTKLNVNRV